MNELFKRGEREMTNPTKTIKGFWKGKGVKCSKCKAINMKYFIKIYGACGNCGKKIIGENLK